MTPSPEDLSWLLEDLKVYTRFLKEIGLDFMTPCPPVPSGGAGGSVAGAPAMMSAGRGGAGAGSGSKGGGKSSASDSKTKASARGKASGSAKASTSRGKTQAPVQAKWDPKAMMDQPLPPALKPAARENAFQQVADEIAQCEACPLSRSRNNTVPGVGSPMADLMFIGEGPGADEDRQGEPFVGRAGRKLDEMIAYLGLERSDVCIVNIVKCRPPANRNPDRNEALACRGFLERQIEIVQPKVICLLGAVALKHMTGDMTASIMKTRGNWIEYRSIATMPTYHPAFLLRQYTEKNRRAVASDIDMIREKLMAMGCKVGKRPGAE